MREIQGRHRGDMGDIVLRLQNLLDRGAQGGEVRPVGLVPRVKRPQVLGVGEEPGKGQGQG